MKHQRPKPFRLKGRRLQTLLLQRLEQHPRPSDIAKAAMSVVNFALETAGVSVEVRQHVNEECFDNAERVIRDLLHVEETPEETADLMQIVSDLTSVIDQPRRDYPARRQRRRA